LLLRIGTDGKILNCSPAGSPKWWHNYESRIPEQIDELFEPDLVRQILPRIQNCLAQNLSEIVEFPAARPLFDGAIEILIVPISDKVAVAALKEIVPESEVEIRLRREQQTLENIIDLNPYAISIWDKDGYFLKANRLWWKWFSPGIPPGYSILDPECNPMIEEFGLQDLRERIIAGEIVVQPPFWFNPRLIGPEYRDLPVYHTITFFSVPGDDGQPEIIVAMYEDKADQKRAEENLAEINRERYDQVRAIAGGTAHEIKNALFPAVAAAKSLEANLTASDSNPRAKLDQTLPLIRNAISRALRMTDSVLEFSSLETERTTEIANLRSVISAVLEANEGRLADSGVNVDYEALDGVRIRCEPRHAHSIFNNLLINALDALEDSNHKNIRISAQRDDDAVRIHFEDSGRGIPETDRHRVFDAFYTTKPKSGTGLGLAVVLKIVHMYDGKIHAEASEGGGARFVMRFPDPDKTDRFNYPAVQEKP